MSRTSGKAKRHKRLRKVWPISVPWLVAGGLSLSAAGALAWLAYVEDGGWGILLTATSLVVLSLIALSRGLGYGWSEIASEVGEQAVSLGVDAAVNSVIDGL